MRWLVDGVADEEEEEEKGQDAEEQQIHRAPGPN